MDLRLEDKSADGQSVGDKIDENSNKSNLPEGIGQCDDSGFASIAGSATTEHSEIDERVTVQQRKAERDRLRLEQLAAKRQAEIQHENERREKAYKCLMHLVTRSKLYSDFLLKKLSGNEVEQPSTSKVNSKRKRQDSDEEELWAPRPKRVTRRKDNDLKEELKKSLVRQIKKKKTAGKVNLSEEEIQAELNAMHQENVDTDVAFEVPKYFVGELRDYQQHGLNWLKALYENGMSGILADEMGLGKTIQVIAMIAHLIEKKIPGPYLIIAPLSTIPNWLLEFEKFAPSIPVILFYGTAEERAQQLRKMKKSILIVDGIKTLPVVLTTYEIPLREKTVMRASNWRYIIIDEGQRIKNPECQLVQLLKTCKSDNRLLLTGTPLQNSLKELWSLLNFLMPAIFSDLAVFESWFSIEDFQHEEGTNRILKQEEEKKVLQSLREILKPFMLRRMKAEVCLDIPPKKEVMVYAPMSKLQLELYKAFLNRDICGMFKSKPDPVIIDDEFGKRPKRKCTVNNRCSNNYKDTFAVLNSSFSSEDESAEPADAMPDSDYTASTSDSSFSSIDDPPAAVECHHTEKSTTRMDKAMEDWTQHVDVNENNRQYLFRMSFGNRQMMYRKIINHPYLIHLPLNEVGLPKIDNDLITASGKFMVLDKMLNKLHESGHKVLLFSTMKIILDVIEDYLLMRPWKYLRLDGEVAIEERKAAIKTFNTNPEYFMFLITTRAGGVGLNLAAADTVIIFDSDWNPQADIQAMARCHRIGQTRPVVIYRLCTKGTFDEAIVNRAEAKRKLEKLVISKEVGEITLTREGLIELKKLLESSSQQVVASEQDSVLTEQELNVILDRSDLHQMNKSNTKHVDDQTTTTNPL